MTSSCAHGLWAQKSRFGSKKWLFLSNEIIWSHEINISYMPRQLLPIEISEIRENCEFGGFIYPWWRHQMETLSALRALCAGNSPVTGEFPAQRPVTRSFDVFFDLRLNKMLSKQSRGWWFLPSPYLSQCWVIVNWALRNTLQRNFNQNTKLPIHEIASENIVCEIAAILS